MIMKIYLHKYVMDPESDLNLGIILSPFLTMIYDCIKMCINILMP